MASPETVKEASRARKDLEIVASDQNFNRIRNNKELLSAWEEARSLAFNWLAKMEPRLVNVDDEVVKPIIRFAVQLTEIAEGSGVRQNEVFLSAVSRVRNEFLAGVPLLAYELLESSGLFQLSENALNKWREATRNEIDNAVAEAERVIKEVLQDADRSLRVTADEAGKEFELAKQRSQKIVVDSAENQFVLAERSLQNKRNIWASMAGLLFVTVMGTLYFLLTHPPELILDITTALRPGVKAVPLPVSIPLLLAASAYFTTLRLAIIGTLGFALAFSLRMTRAYFHMIEHNQHKLRVTRSIQAFVAAVRGDERKDLVLGKLVESVTDFGEPGILAKDEKNSSFPAVIFENLTKNIAKAD